MNSKPTLSASKLNMLFRCAEQYRRRYIEGEILPPGVNLPVGTSVHKAAEMNLQHWMETEQYITLEEACEVARDTFEYEWQNTGVKFTEEEVEQGMTAVKGAAVDDCVRMSVVHYNRVAPLMRPVALERFWRIELARFPFDLSGKTDLEDSTRVRDLKVTGKTPSQDAADTSLQLTLYAMAFAHQYNNPPHSVCLDNLVKLKTAKYVPLESTREARHFTAALRRVEIAAELIAKEVWIPARVDDWSCTPKWCGYHDTCKYAHGWKQYTGGNGV